jgi:hypothetical protein
MPGMLLAEKEEMGQVPCRHGDGRGDNEALPPLQLERGN